MTTVIYDYRYYYIVIYTIAVGWGRGRLAKKIKPSKKAHLKSKLAKIFEKCYPTEAGEAYQAPVALLTGLFLRAHILKLNIKSKDKIFLYELANDF